MTEVSPPAASTPRRPPSRRRLWLFRVLAIGLGLAPLVLLELVLRAVGYGFETRLVVPAPQAQRPADYYFNPAVDRAYYGRVDLRGPEPRTFRLPKPPELFRIVVVGGSTVAGFPYSFELSFPRQLEIVLKEQNPGRRFEVLNAGITAINSTSEVDLVRQTLACEPDLIVLHSGHNEFYGAGSLASTAGGLPSRWFPFLCQVRRQRTYQLFTAWLRRPLEKDLQATLPADIAIPLDGLLVGQAAQNYKSNLEQAAALAAAGGVPVMLTTIPANLRDLSPMSSLSKASLTESEKRQQADRLAAAERHMTDGQWEPALALLQAALQTDPENALFAYRQAQCLEMLQRFEEAGAAYTRAADLDGCRFRAPSALAAAVREAAANAEQNVYFCDVSRQLGEASALPAPGADFFLEHVHYNLDGHWQVALILGECIQQQVLNAPWRADRVPTVERRDELLAVTPFDYLVGDTFALMTLKVWPLKMAPDSQRQIQLLTARMQQRYQTLGPLDQRLFADLSLAAMEHDVLAAMGHSYLAAGEDQKALAMFLGHIVRRPWEPLGYDNAAAILRRQGKTSQASRLLEFAADLDPNEGHLADRIAPWVNDER